MSQAWFVGRFEQSGSKVPVNFDGTADHAIRKLSNSTFVSFVVAFFPLRGFQRFEWRTKRLRNMSHPSRLGGDRHLESQTIGPCQRRRSSLHRDSDVFAPS